MKMRILTIVALLVGGVCLPASAQEGSLADAARKAREHKKEAPKARRVFSNDDIPSRGAGVSTVGTAAQAGSSTTPDGAAGTTAATGDTTATPDDKAKASADDEAKWRKKFGELRAKIATTEKEIDVMQRELNLNQQQYYSDPNVAMRQQYSRSDINDGKKAIDTKKAELEALKQQLAELQDDLRRAGAPSSWASE
jgi:hypothetical protein